MQGSTSSFTAKAPCGPTVCPYREKLVEEIVAKQEAKEIVDKAEAEREQKPEAAN